MKAKEKFEEWLKTTSRNEVVETSKFDNWIEPNDFIDEFYDLPLSYQWGVYLEFFDSEGVYISMKSENNNRFVWDIWTEKLYEEHEEETRQQAQAEAVKKAFEILDERL